MGWDHTCAIRMNNELHCWGASHFRESILPATKEALAVAIGGQMNCVLFTDNTWQCGGTFVDQPRLPASGAGVLFKDIAANSISACGIKLDGRIECWYALPV